MPNVRDEGDVRTDGTGPGLQAEDLKIEVLEDVVSIEGEMPAEEAEFLRQEIRAAPSARDPPLPAALQADKVEAHIADGILTLRLPNPMRRDRVRSGRGKLDSGLRTTSKGTAGLPAVPFDIHRERLRKKAKCQRYNSADSEDWRTLCAFCSEVVL